MDDKPTILLYWLPNPAYRSHVTVSKIIQCSGDEATTHGVICFDQTILHPTGGGQFNDTGSFTNKEGSKFEIVDVILNKTLGTVEHKFKYEDQRLSLCNGDLVTIEVNPERRAKARCLHSAGHLLDVAMKKMNVNWVPGKGVHELDNCYVEYIYDKDIKEWNPELQKELLDNLGKTIEDLVVAEIPTKVEIDDVLLNDENTATIQPIWTSRRSVTVGGLDCPCGGTHVNNTNELKGVKVKSVAKKRKNIRVSYEVVSN